MITSWVPATEKGVEKEGRKREREREGEARRKDREEERAERRWDTRSRMMNCKARQWIRGQRQAVHLPTMRGPRSSGPTKVVRKHLSPCTLEAVCLNNRRLFPATISRYFVSLSRLTHRNIASRDRRDFVI